MKTIVTITVMILNSLIRGIKLYVGVAPVRMEYDSGGMNGDFPVGVSDAIIWSTILIYIISLLYVVDQKTLCIILSLNYLYILIFGIFIAPTIHFIFGIEFPDKPGFHFPTKSK